MSEFSIVPRKKKGQKEKISIEVRDGKIYIYGECEVLKKLKLIECDKDCDSCWCG